MKVVLCSTTAVGQFTSVMLLAMNTRIPAESPAPLGRTMLFVMAVIRFAVPPSVCEMQIPSVAVPVVWKTLSLTVLSGIGRHIHTNKVLRWIRRVAQNEAVRYIARHLDLIGGWLTDEVAVEAGPLEVVLAGR